MTCEKTRKRNKRNQTLNQNTGDKNSKSRQQCIMLETKNRSHKSGGVTMSICGVTYSIVRLVSTNTTSTTYDCTYVSLRLLFTIIVQIKWNNLQLQSWKSKPTSVTKSQYRCHQSCRRQLFLQLIIALSRYQVNSSTYQIFPSQSSRHNLHVTILSCLIIRAIHP